MRRDEEFARIAFSRHLALCLSPEAATWLPGSNPPDYELQIGGVVFAVEVTRVCEQVPLRGRLVPAEGIEASLSRFVDDLRDAVLAEGPIPGSYVLSLDGGEITREQVDRAKSLALKYVGETALSETAAEESLLRSGEAEWTIEKMGATEPLIEEITCASLDGISGDDIRVGFPKLVAEAVATKRHKLRNVSEPKVLLLVDAYHYAEAPDWANALPPEAASFFHTAARVHGEYECQMLITAASEWGNQ